jgi:hypothetical protein
VCVCVEVGVRDKRERQKSLPRAKAAIAREGKDDDDDYECTTLSLCLFTFRSLFFVVFMLVKHKRTKPCCLRWRVSKCLMSSRRFRPAKLTSRISRFGVRLIPSTSCHIKNQYGERQQSSLMELHVGNFTLESHIEYQFFSYSASNLRRPPFISKLFSQTNSLTLNCL